MKNAFNEFGKPEERIDTFAYDLEKLTRDFLCRMVEEGYSATDIRATAGYLSGCVDVTGSEAIFYVADKLRKEKIANSNNDISPEEDALLQADYTKNKIPVIKMYRERTGLGLKEAKDTIENWWKWHTLIT